MSVSKLTPGFIQSLEYTNKVLPQEGDPTWKKIAKWALIICSLCSVFVVTLLMDVTKKIIIKLSGRQTAAIPKPLTPYEKVVKFATRFWETCRSSALQIFQTSAYHSQRLSPYNKYAKTAGHIVGSVGIFYLGSFFGMSGVSTALTLGVAGAAYKPLKENVFVPLKEHLNQ